MSGFSYEGLTERDLKYGFCSYFALAYEAEVSSVELFEISEWDDFLEKNYLVHYVLYDGDCYIDALGRYKNWEDSVEDMLDVAYMDLSIRKVTKEEVMYELEDKVGYEKEFYDRVEKYVKEKHG